MKPGLIETRVVPKYQKYEVRHGTIRISSLWRSNDLNPV